MAAATWLQQSTRVNAPHERAGTAWPSDAHVACIMLVHSIKERQQSVHQLLFRMQQLSAALARFCHDCRTSAVE
jgi:hypothetical protein